EERDADGRDQRDEARRRPERTIRDPLDEDRQAAADRHAGDENHDQHDDPGEGIEQPGALQAQEDLDSDERAGDEDLAVREVDELQHAVHHRVAERDERIHEPENESVEEDLGKDADEELPFHRRGDLRARMAGGARAPPLRRMTAWRWLRLLALWSRDGQLLDDLVVAPL